jgi:hypothetical protein
MDPKLIILVVVAAVLLVVVAALAIRLGRRSRSERLREHFGPEYERSVSRTGDREVAEAELTERQERRRELDIRDLRPEERTRFHESWTTIQRDFVDDPARALHEADMLVVEVMRLRGYPVEDFDRRADDISVDHPDVVHHYREARRVQEASTDHSVDTERQRRALTSYRLLVEALLGRTRRGRSADRATNRAADTEINDYPASETRATEERSR